MCLPVVLGPKKPLIFRSWKPGDSLERKGKLNILEPFDSQEELKPDIFLIPMIAFADDCHRIGYGGGFYDMTLKEYENIVTIGIAFEAQKITEY